MILLFAVLYTFLPVHHIDSDKSMKRDKCPDLIVKEIKYPDWIDDKTIIEVEIKNIGKAPSEPCIAMMYDLDISIKEAKDLGLEDYLIELVEENVSRADYYANSEYYQGNEYYAKNVTENDYDIYFEVFKEIPAIEPGKIITITFEVEDEWLFNTNCELEVIIDPDNAIEECDKTNNKLQFFAWG